jgi:hypothetical protein
MSVDAKWLEGLHRELGRLLIGAELKVPDNPPGTYPEEFLMALRLAWVASGRALRDAREATAQCDDAHLEAEASA